MKKIFSFSILISLLIGGLVLAHPNIIEGKISHQFKFITPSETEDIAPQFESLIPLEGISPQVESVIPEETEEIAPQFKFVAPREKISGQVEIKGRVKDANSVEFYYQMLGADFPIYLGLAQSKGENLWEYSWDTNLTPNGEYQIFAKIINQYGEYFSEKITIVIDNEIKKEEEKEEQKKEEIEKTKEEIEKEDRKIEEREEKTEKEVVEETEKAVTRSIEILEESEKEKIEPEIKKKSAEMEEEIEETIKTMGGMMRKATNLEKEIEKRRKKIKEIEEEIEKIKTEIKEIEKAKEKAEKAGLIKQIEQAERIIEAKQEKIESLFQEKEKIEAEIKKLEEEKERVRWEKEKKKEEILETVTEPIKIIEKVVPEEKKAQISETKEKIKKDVSGSLSEFEREVAEREKIKAEKEEILIKDSDRDGLSDSFELLIGTNSFNPDSDGDGFLDGNEYKLGYNPLKPGPTDKVVYTDAKKTKPQKTEIYYVERVTKITLPTGQIGIKIEGKGLPNSFVTIYIYSAPIVMVTKADGNGNWSIVLDKPLADGTHEVYTTVTNNYGKIEARSEPFIFEKSGERIVAITISGLLTEKAISPIQTYQLGFLILTISLIILAIGIALGIIGLSAQRRLKKDKRK